MLNTGQDTESSFLYRTDLFISEDIWRIFIFFSYEKILGQQTTIFNLYVCRHSIFVRTIPGLLGLSSILVCRKWQYGLSHKPLAKNGQFTPLKYPEDGNILSNSEILRGKLPAALVTVNVWNQRSFHCCLHVWSAILLS